MKEDFENAVRIAHEILDPYFNGRDFEIKKGDALLPILVLLEYGELAPLKRVVRFNDFELESLLESARNKAAEFDAVVELCTLRAESGPFEAALKVFHAEMLRGQIRRPKKPGPNAEKHKSRNYIIAHAVHSVQLECSLTPFRNSSENSMQESACDAVAVALGENGYHAQEYAAVAKIVNNWDLLDRMQNLVPARAMRRKK